MIRSGGSVGSYKRVTYRRHWDTFGASPIETQIARVSRQTSVRGPRLRNPARSIRDNPEWSQYGCAISKFPDDVTINAFCGKQVGPSAVSSGDIPGRRRSRGSAQPKIPNLVRIPKLVTLAARRIRSTDLPLISRGSVDSIGFQQPQPALQLQITTGCMTADRGSQPVACEH